MRRATITAVLAAGLLLTACTGSDSDKTAKPSASPKATAAPTAEESATSDAGAAEDALKEAEEDFEKSLDDLENALGETLGVQEGTYEVTNSQPQYDDPSLALDDEYITPGTYTSKGPADQELDCYWARMRNASGQSESSIANDLAAGRAIVKLTEGEFFKTSGCKPWTRSGD
ncbi:hypothetical protein ACFYNL_10395 [Streptomyces sp. NPDC007808]|uniref:hypothetical protein n=1 Tax=Streptomyces sp. NPDC007808 TaxID=3364779 RepID=UPI0036AEBEA2